MYRRFVSILLVLCLFVCMAPSFALADSSSGTFTYASFLNPGKSAELDYTYNDSWFSRTGYQHDLAKMTLRMAIAGANANADNIKALFDKLGYTYTSSSIDYPAPTADSIGYAIASRKTTDSKGNDCTIIAVVIRGNGYGKEWASNFTVGKGNEHKGFGDSADIVAKAVKSYIQSLGVTENIKLWTTGYSRAAAVSNILGQRFNKWAESGEVKGVSKNGIYAYTFETPRTVKFSAEGNYTNIFNITNYNDLVTKVVPAAWSFGRYGITYFLPCSELSADYAVYNKAANAELAKIAASVGIPAPSMPLADDTGSYTDILLDRLAAFCVDQSNYFSTIQDLFRKNIMSMDISLTAANFTSALTTAAGDMLIDFAMSNLSVASRLLGDGAARMVSYHYPEYCLALLDSMSGVNDFADPVTRHITIGGSAVITVYDKNGNKAAYTDGNKIVNASGSSVTSYVNDKLQKVFVLPAGSEYTVELKISRSGNINCTVEEYNAYDESISRSAIYKSVAVKSGEVLSIKLDKLTKNANPQYDLVKGNGELIAADKKTGISKPSSDNPADADLPFTDVKKGDKYYNDVAYVYANKLMNGTSATEFSPDSAITRGMIVTILYRLENEPAVDDSSVFSDVKHGKYYSNAVTWASTNKIVEGMGDGTFAPDKNITLEQLAAILFRYVEFKKIDTTVDTSSSGSIGAHSWAEEAVRWCVKNGLMELRYGGAYAMAIDATRGDSAFALHYLSLALGK